MLPMRAGSSLFGESRTLKQETFVKSVTHLGAGEGESGYDENVAEAFEAVVECTWVMPVRAADIA